MFSHTVSNASLIHFSFSARTSICFCIPNSSIKFLIRKRLFVSSFVTACNAVIPFSSLNAFKTLCLKKRVSNVFGDDKPIIAIGERLTHTVIAIAGHTNGIIVVAATPHTINHVSTTFVVSISYPDFFSKVLSFGLYTRGESLGMFVVSQKGDVNSSVAVHQSSGRTVLRPSQVVHQIGQLGSATILLVLA